MNQFLANLTPQQTKIFYVAVCVVVLALFDRLLIGPTMGKLDAIEETIASEESSIKSDLKFLARRDQILKEIELFQPYYADAIPKEEEVMGAFLDKLDKLVKESDLTLTKNNRSNELTDEEKASRDVLVYKADLECSGSLENVAQLLYKIDTSKEFLKVLKLNLTLKKTGEVEEMKAVMTVAKYIVLSTSLPDASSTPSASTASSKAAVPPAANSR